MINMAFGLGALVWFAVQDVGGAQDAVAVNEAVQSVRADWGRMESHRNRTELDYVVLDRRGAVLYRTKPGLSESVNEAVRHRDTVLDIEDEGIVAGRVIFYNESVQEVQEQKARCVCFLAAVMLLQWGACVGYAAYLHYAVIRPFRKLKDFAGRVAGGNLDIPLEMDRRNLFGAFTESFDIMRCELKKARAAEAKANADKKELVAELSHDIKTPVASIKAAAEVGAALAERAEGRSSETYLQIIRKADQINTLVTNLFTATLEELEQLTVEPGDIEGGELECILENADYLHRGAVPRVPDCLLYADRLRLQQVFDNIFANSYKYADTGIVIRVCREERYLAVSVEDYGGGVREEELPLLKEKFRRGSNTGEAEGAGLGLYLSEYFMRGMQGKLRVENGENGLKVVVLILLSGAAQQPGT